MRTFLTTLVLALTFTVAVQAQDRLIEPYLEKGDLAAARQAVTAALEGSPKSEQLLLQLALVQLLQSVETYSQQMYGMGLKESLFGGMIPFLRFPVEPNPVPSPATNQKARQSVDALSKGLAEARQTLSEIPDSWDGRLPLRLGRVRMDFDGDGVARPKEELWRLVDALNPGMPLDEKTARQFGMHLDAGDVRWLEGYCHLLNGLADMALAYDTQRLFDHTGHLFFQNAESPFPFLVSVQSGEEEWMESLVDAVAFLHLLDLPLLEAGRLADALGHFREVIALSRRSWNNIISEKDNQHEWIPNPSQRSVIPGWEVTAEMIEQWLAFLTEADSVLAGETLLPFWRELPAGQGLNLNKVFTQPQRFDAVLWMQGTAAAPYLEEGRVTPRELWDRLDRVFGGQFLGFAAWFN
jgi:hypothetical protein